MQTVKPLAHIVCLLALGAVSCNDEVFIDDFLPEIPAPELDERNSHVALEFESDNWDVLYATGRAGILTAHIFDTDGSDDGRGTGLKGLGTMVYDLDEYSFRIERNAPDMLELHLVENMQDEPEKITVTVGNDVETKTLQAVLHPTSKYAVDRVEFEWDGFESHDGQLELADAFIVDNSKNETPVTFYVNPYADARREILFTDSYSTPIYYFGLWLGDPLPKITIPDVADGLPEPDGPEVEFCPETRYIDCGLDPEHTERVEIGAGLVREVNIYLVTETYRVPYTVHATNPFNGREKTFSGILKSSRPYDCRVFALEKTEP